MTVTQLIRSDDIILTGYINIIDVRHLYKAVEDTREQTGHRRRRREAQLPAVLALQLLLRSERPQALAFDADVLNPPVQLPAAGHQLVLTS